LAKTRECQRNEKMVTRNSIFKVVGEAKVEQQKNDILRQIIALPKLPQNPLS
jgi:hypothetical protein